KSDTECEARGTHGFDVLHETEGARTAYFLGVRMLGKIDQHVAVFRAEHGMRKIDGEIEHEAMVWLEACPFIILPDLHRRLDAQVTLRCRLFFDAGGLEKVDEGTGAAIEDRKFGTGDVDMQII